MKKYIFFTANITVMGGMQCYVAAKTQYLLQHNWDVCIFFCDSNNSKKCDIPLLDKFIGGKINLLINPPFKYPDFIVENGLRKMKKLSMADNYDEIIVESHDSITSQWAELLSEKINARHFIYTLNEIYRGKNKFYEICMDFYDFKFKRNEIIGDMPRFNRLFEGYKTLTIDDVKGVMKITESPIQDIESPLIDNISRADWNICYLGREDKGYVENIIRGVGEFANMYSSKIIQLIVLFKVIQNRELLGNLLANNKNLKLLELGFLSPIPRSLYKKIDVVIAGSGSAFYSANEGALTIVADAETYQSNGLLGYETLSSIYHDDNSVVSSFCDALKRVLVDKCYITMQKKWEHVPTIEECMENDRNLFAYAVDPVEYYDSKKIIHPNSKNEKSGYFKTLIGLCILKLSPKTRIFLKKFFRPTVLFKNLLKIN